MLKQPMIEKLAAMRLLGMLEALKTQEQDPAARELSFSERFGRSDDQQSNWRGHQALGPRLTNCEASRERLCRRDRLSHGPRPRQKCDPLVDARISLGRHA